MIYLLTEKFATSSSEDRDDAYAEDGDDKDNGDGKDAGFSFESAFSDAPVFGCPLAVALARGRLIGLARRKRGRFSVD